MGRAIRTSRAEQAINSRRAIVEAAVRLMIARGVAATTVDAICAEVGLTKGAFFHHFADKDELLAAALDGYCAWLAAALGDGPYRRKRDPLRRALAFVDHAAATLGRAPIAGCLLAACTQELAPDDDELRERCRAGFRDVGAVLRSLLAEVPRGATSFDPDALADHFVVVLEGALLLARASGDAKVTARHLAHFRRYLELIVRPAG
jgi:TetR/AcrR family transcriptional repressor of nem operon